MDRRLILTLVLVLVLAGCGSEPESTEAIATTDIDRPSTGSNAELPQFAITPDGTLKLVWVAREAGVVDLYAASWEDEADFAPVRINTDATRHSPVVIDEMRPAIAVAPPNRMAIAWTDTNYDIQLAVSEDGGRTFSAPLRLNQDEGEALQEFPSIAFDAAGVVHAAWLDPRLAGEPVEEPADLFYARIDGNEVVETNLTVDQESTVCGCCLPDLRIDGESIRITFRNTMNGFRDPFQVLGTTEGAFEAPRAVTAPVWEINACPVAGPIGVGENALWLDGSTGVRRLLESQGAGTEPRVVFADSESWRLALPPRRIEGDETWILVPAEPAAYVVGRNEAGAWETVADDLPGWVTDAAIVDGELRIVGASGGRYVESRRAWP